MSTPVSPEPPADQWPGIEAAVAANRAAAGLPPQLAPVVAVPGNEVQPAGIYPARPLSNTANTSQMDETLWDRVLPEAVADLAAKEWHDRATPPEGYPVRPAWRHSGRWHEPHPAVLDEEWGIRKVGRLARCLTCGDALYPAVVAVPEAGEEEAVLPLGHTFREPIQPSTADMCIFEVEDFYGSQRCCRRRSAHAPAGPHYYPGATP